MSSHAPALIAVRHAPTAAAGLCVGASEVQVLVKHEAAAAAVLAALAQQDAAPVQVWTSESSRCLGIATIVARSLGVDLRVDARLGELSFGAWEGRAYAEIATSEPEAYARWMAQWRELSPPGGERLEQLVARVESWWRELPRGADQLLVAHAGVIRALRVIVRGDAWDVAMATPVPHLVAETFPFAAPTPR